MNKIESALTLGTKILIIEMQRLGVFTLFVFFGLGFWACAECDPTPGLPRNITVAFFKRDSPEVTLDTAFYMVYGARIDTALVDLGADFEFLNPSDSLLFSVTDTPQILLPLDFRLDTIAYIFIQKFEEDTIPLTGIDFDGKIRRFDTLIFGYDNELIILGPDCGFVETVSNLSIIKNTFDSTALRNTEITTDSINVEIYL